MKTSLILAFYFLLQAEVPFKNEDEYKVQIDLKFKKRQAEFNPLTFTTPGSSKSETHEVAEAFLVVNVKEVKILPDEVKIQGLDSNGKSVFKRKISSEDIKIEMGFVSDLKKGIANEFALFFLSAEKKQVRKILFTVKPDGTFEVNGKWHGQF